MLERQPGSAGRQVGPLRETLGASVNTGKPGWWLAPARPHLTGRAFSIRQLLSAALTPDTQRATP